MSANNIDVKRESSSDLDNSSEWEDIEEKKTHYCPPFSIHFPKQVPQMKHKIQHTFKKYNCVRCWDEALFYCPRCVEKPKLCLPCFRWYHDY